MRLTTRSCRLGGTISARMKRWRSSGSTVGCAIGLPAFGDGPVLCRKRSRWSTPPCTFAAYHSSNSGKTHLATESTNTLASTGPFPKTRGRSSAILKMGSPRSTFASRIAVGIAGDNRQHAKPQDLIEPMGNLARLPRILQASRRTGPQGSGVVRHPGNSSRLPLADVHRSSMTAVIGLSPIGDKLGRTSVNASRWVGAPRARIGVDNQNLCPLMGSATPTAFVNNPG